MKYLNRTSLILLAASAPMLATAAPASSPKIAPFSAQYALYHHGSKVGTSITTLSYPTPHRYHCVSKTDLRVLFFHKHYQEDSVGNVTKQGYQATQYAMSSNGKSIDQTRSIPDGVQDPLSEVLTLRHYLLAGEAPKAVSTMTAKGKQTYTFKIVNPHQTITTALGKLVVAQVRFFDDKGNQVNEWLAKKYNYLPAAIKISKNKDTSGMIYLTNVR